MIKRRASAACASPGPGESSAVGSASGRQRRKLSVITRKPGEVGHSAPTRNARTSAVTNMPACLPACPRASTDCSPRGTGVASPPALEERAEVAHQHLLDLILGDTRLAERGEDVVGDVVVVPQRASPPLVIFVD